VTGNMTTQYDAAIELCQALDTFRLLEIAGRVTGEDANRVKRARQRWDGSDRAPVSGVRR
jgi:hypothetical protein